MIELDQVSDSTTFPTRVDVAIVGGGIIGVCAGYELARRGLSVGLFEKGVVGGEQSGRNWGWVRQQNRHLSELPLAMYAIRRWAELGPETGEDLGFRREGIVYCTTRERDLSQWLAWGKSAASIGFSSQALSAREAQSKNSFSTSSWLGGLYSSTDGKAEPSLAAPAMARAFKQQGGYLHQRCAVRGVDIALGRVQGIWTEHGKVQVDSVLVCGGAWSSRFCRRHGIDLPAVNVVGTALKTGHGPEITTGSIMTPSLAIRRRLDKGYTVAIPGRGLLDVAPLGIHHAMRFMSVYRGGLDKRLTFRASRLFFRGPEALGRWKFGAVSPFEKTRILDPKIDARSVRESMRRLYAEYPSLESVKIESAWAGAIDTTPDLLPVIAEANTLKNLFIASGFSGHGFGLGPGGGRLAADLITGSQPIVDPSPYRLERFHDGTSLVQPDLM